MLPQGLFCRCRKGLPCCHKGFSVAAARVPLLTQGLFCRCRKRPRLVAWYNKFVAIPSMQSLYQGNSNYVHDRLSFELEATTLAHDFYGKNSVLNNYTFPTFYNFPVPLDHDNSPPFWREYDGPPMRKGVLVTRLQSSPLTIRRATF